jgi:hypothetical protein
MQFLQLKCDILHKYITLKCITVIMYRMHELLCNVYIYLIIFSAKHQRLQFHAFLYRSKTRSKIKRITNKMMTR